MRARGVVCVSSASIDPRAESDAQSRANVRGDCAVTVAGLFLLGGGTHPRARERPARAPCRA